MKIKVLSNYFTTGQDLKEFWLFQRRKASKLLEESGQHTYINRQHEGLVLKNMVFLTAWQTLIRVAIISEAFLFFSWKSNKVSSGCCYLRHCIKYKRASYWKHAHIWQFWQSILPISLISINADSFSDHLSHRVCLRLPHERWSSYFT